MTRIAIIAALAAELKPLVRGWSRESRRGVDLWRRRQGDGVWIAACAGIGADAATRAFTEIEKDGGVDVAVSVGWAGALREQVAAGRAYRVSGVVDARTGERFPASAWPGDCWLVTASRVAHEMEKRRLAAIHGADLVDMEAAAVARLAGKRGIPFGCIKGVSDGLADRIPDLDDFISPQGDLRWGRLVLSFLIRPAGWPALIRMRRNSRRAAERLAESLLEILAEWGTMAGRDDNPPGKI